METSNDSSYVSAITSPSRSSIDSMYYYSAPSSPSKTLVNTTFSSNLTEPTTPTSTSTSTYQETNSLNLQLFVNHTEITDIGSPKSWKSEKMEFHSMDVADELFCEGKVVMTLKPQQLKLPPCLLSKTKVKFSKRNSTTMSSFKFKSSLSSLKFPFSRHYLLNDDFDPFMVALEKVRREPNENSPRRARSLTPLKAHTPSRSNSNLGFNLHQNIELSPQKQINKYNKKSPIRRTEPKQKVRLVKVTHRWPDESANRTTLVGSETKTSEVTGSCKNMTKMQKVKKFLSRSGSIGKVTKRKMKDVNEALWKPTLLGRFSFRSARYVERNKKDTGCPTLK